MPQALDPLLLVDDDPVRRGTVVRRLARSGHTVISAASGQEALAQLASRPIALVLLTGQLKGMGGLEALRSIRETWPIDRLPVLMVITSEERDGIATALDLGANDFVVMPLNFPVVLARLRSHLARREAEDRLRVSEERYALASRGAHDGLWDWDLVRNELRYAPRWKAIIGCADDEISNDPGEWFDRVHSEDLPRLQQQIEAHLSGRTAHFECEHRMRHKSGAFRWVLTRGLAVGGPDGTPVRMAGSQADITDGKVVDALTGLPNRMLLLDRLEQALQHQQAHPDAGFAVFFVDLDGFKEVNDRFGHLNGDGLLQVVARRLEHSLRPGDVVARAQPELRPAIGTEHTLARLGGDEFVLLLNEVRDVVDATRVADRLQRSLARPFPVAGDEISLSASIGIAVSATGYTESDEVLRDADTAMYRAKALGRGRSEVFDGVMREQVSARFELDSALKIGLERHEFLPHYQPVFDLHTGLLYGFEALVRWQHPKRGLVLPGEFVSAIEENGLIVPIGRQFFRDVSAQARIWNATWPGGQRLAMSVNFASHQFIEIGLAGYLLEILDDAGIEPGQISIEITEATAIADLDRTTDVVHRLRDAGIAVILDDFGTGYLSLACLHELPIAGIKLDRSLVRPGRCHPAILETIITLASRLGLSVTAEGIETEAQRDALRQLGCPFGQGYLFARPLDVDAAGELVRARADSTLTPPRSAIPVWSREP